MSHYIPKYMNRQFSGETVWEYESVKIIKKEDADHYYMYRKEYLISGMSGSSFRLKYKDDFTAWSVDVMNRGAEQIEEMITMLVKVNQDLDELQKVWGE